MEIGLRYIEVNRIYVIYAYVLFIFHKLQIVTNRSEPCSVQFR